MSKELKAAAQIGETSKSWAFEQARALVKHLEKSGKDDGSDKKEVLFETGFGASGLPHLGTFGEVVRTTMVRRAFEYMTGRNTRLICFSDDMDGLRKVPLNVPNREMLAEHLEKPLTKIPDPFGEDASFGEHNNRRLREFLDEFGFEYEFASASKYYAAGKFDATLKLMLKNYDKVLDIILPTLGAERRETYSPFLPICETSGKVLMVKIEPQDGEMIAYIHPDTGARVETSICGGRVKLQWKADWAARWAALGIDYEMAGKDLDESVKLSRRIAQVLGATPPQNYIYELFLDEAGEKISKTKGNGLSIEEWLKYAPPESLSLYMYQKPRTAKRLYFDVIPKAVDEYLAHLEKYKEQSPAERLENPVWHIHNGNPPQEEVPISFALLLNLAVASNADDEKLLANYVAAYRGEFSAEKNPLLSQLVGYALQYARDFSVKNYIAPDEKASGLLKKLQKELLESPDKKDAEALQKIIYAVGKDEYENLRDWFKIIYQVLLGQEQGPRFGTFVAIYGVEETCQLIDDALQGKLK